ncbi:MAG: FAD-dependent oxidoreductase [Desulfobacteraceae bacterium]|nr:MAG: FAD-dependent oxidoreductase [Desulfobacteraceae bacterium]
MSDSSDFEVIVIGSGIGGLTAAAALSKAGRKVLVLERHNIPGGYAQTFVRGRFEFDVALHWLSGIGTPEKPGPLGLLLGGLGIAQKLSFIPIREFLRCVIPGLDITMPFGIEENESFLSTRFPKEAGEIKHFFGVMRSLAAEMQAVGPGRQPVDLTPYPTLRTYQGRNLADVLTEMISNERLRLALAQPGNYFSQPYPLISFNDYIFVFSMFLNYGAVLIKGKAQALSQAFVDVIEECGGTVRFNKGVSRILVKDGSVRGVLAEDGSKIHCPCVVSNADPINTCLQLIGRDAVPLWYLKQLSTLTAGGGVMSVYLGLDCPNERLGLFNHTTFLMREDKGDLSLNNAKAFDMLKSGEAFTSLPALGVAIANYSASDPDYAPPGTTMMSISTGTYGSTWLGLSPSEYDATKRALAEQLIGRAERVVPGLRDHIEEMEIGTPLTNIRYTGNYGGSFVGFGETRTIDPKRINTRGPLEGLYFTGSWVNGGAIPVCTMSGMMAAMAVMEDLSRGSGREPFEQVKALVEPGLKDAGELTGAGLRREKALMTTLHPGRIKLKVLETIEETSSCRTLRLEPVEGNLPLFKAGQFINLFVLVDGIATSRPYTISSPPGRSYYDITVRRKPDGFVSHYLLDRVKAGDVLTATEPAGVFLSNTLVNRTDMVFLAGGSGITPFASFLRQAVENRPAFAVQLIYGSRSPEDVIFQEELTEMQRRNPAVKVDLVISDPPAGWKGHKGFIDAELIHSLVGSTEGKTFFVAGPPEMHRLVDHALKTLKVPARRIKKEPFGPSADVTLEKGWPGISKRDEFKCMEDRTGKTFTAAAGDPLIVSMEKAGIVVPAQCRVGRCSACRTRLISGDVFIPAYDARRWADARAGYIHPCVSYPIGNLHIKLP